MSRFYEAVDSDSALRTAPAALRNREPIADVLANWLPANGVVLEIASGTGEHAAHFAERFANLTWQPSDSHPDALASIEARCARAGLTNLKMPVAIDAASPIWPIPHADAILCSNMVHISPWDSALGLLDGATRLLGVGGPMILYGPWLSNEFETAPSNLEFDADLKRRDSRWGLRAVSTFAGEAQTRGLALVDQRPMPANNIMLLFRRVARAAG